MSLIICDGDQGKITNPLFTLEEESDRQIDLTECEFK